MIAADNAMYEAKRNKRHSACYYTDEIGDKISERNQLSSKLRHAIENEQLYLVFQPIICSNSGTIKGYEALTRWNLDGTHINPELVVSLAEDIGASEIFYKWLIKTALKETSHFLKQSQFVAINVSAKQFLDEYFLTNTRQFLSMYDDFLIELEITETSLLTDFEETTYRIDELNKLGIKVMIDDFGTGYSSLSRLKHLNVDKIKIDRSFLLDAEIDPKSAGIYESIVGLAQKLDIDVVAEGIETTQQFAFLGQFSPIYMQGYLFQKPLPKEKQRPEAEIRSIILKTDD
ncbi:EAL domain-containing protein [Vibrio algarum]|uniref:EAL domain-containing protein n=1 Tax=Vibrio algarum TaxID=3020714 RepID=A0ABT4YV90_9VIBR|nr:EAL domain-containing protein [Vibrio sp. KJ40-1]MDB1125495.1 EAL domain-containing protein [Vibrio sp. KJ40-1]